MNKLILVLSIFILINNLNAQSYFFPKLNLKIIWSVNEETTRFSVVFNTTNLLKKWVGIGINKQDKLVY